MGETVAAERFEDLVRALGDRPGVTPPGTTPHRGFGSAALTVQPGASTGPAPVPRTRRPGDEA